MSTLDIPWQSGTEIRRKFVEFFESKGHLHVPSSSLVPPAGDQSVLLTTAGMQQMIPYFLGLEEPPAARMCTIQKCYRTVDIDEVGDDSHCTFFLMLGNFSVRDYFKRESLAWSWEFLTEWMGIPAEHLYPTIYPDDDESLTILRDEVGVPEARIHKLEDNWWRLGPTGPNGPDCEFYVDLGEHLGPDAVPGDDGPRFLEVWNNVLMQYNTTADGVRSPLPKPCIDTGMGYERLVMVVQGARTMYDTDIYAPIVAAVASRAGVTYDADPQTDRSIRIVADHLRGAVFLIADGVLPGNEGRAYVLRRVLRKAIRHGRLLGIEGSFLPDIAEIVIRQWGDDHPELEDRRGQILKVLRYEETSFGRTLDSGMNRVLEQTQSLWAQVASQNAALVKLAEEFNRPATELAKAVAQPRAELLDSVQRVARLADEIGRSPAEVTTAIAKADVKIEDFLERVEPPILPGADVFRLYDTYGFPFDLTTEIAREQGLQVDDAGFEAAMARQREASRSFSAFQEAGRDRGELYANIRPRTEFTGYELERADASIVAVFGASGPVEQAEAGEQVEVVLDRTPFYGESGGQVGDSGEIRSETGLVNIDDTRKPAPDLFVHRGTVEEGFIRVGDTVTAQIDAARRQEIRRNHTATHLLHKALRLVVGTDTHQAGSLVAPDRLRFDFTALDAVDPDQVRTIAEIVNREIVANRPVETAVTSYAEAVAAGAMALFGEKYGDTVRVVAIDDFSKELCGGTHVSHTGEIGPFVVTSEGSVASGIRRIEALTGDAAIQRMLGQQRLIEELGRELRVSWTEVPAQLRALQERTRAQEREIERLRGQVAGAQSGDLLSRAVDVNGIPVLATRVMVENRADLRQLGDRLRDSMRSGVIVLGAVVDGKPSLLAMVTPDLTGRGVRAGDIIRAAAAHIDGRGGGRPELAEAGGKDASGLDAAIDAVRGLVEGLVPAEA